MYTIVYTSARLNEASILCKYQKQESAEGSGAIWCDGEEAFNIHFENFVIITTALREEPLVPKWIFSYWV